VIFDEKRRADLDQASAIKFPISHISHIRKESILHKNGYVLVSSNE